MLKNRGIVFKLVLFFTLSSTCIFAVVFGYNYYLSRRTIEKGIEEKANSLITAATSRIETILSATQKVPEGIAYFLENSPHDEKLLLHLLRTVAEKNPEIYGIAVAFEPFGFKKDSELYAPYFYKEAPGKVGFKYIEKNYNYLYVDAYQIPKELDRPMWSEPYFGEGGGTIMSSYSVPFYKVVNEKRQLAGVVVVDISVETLQDIVSSIKIFRTGYAFLISKNGTFVTHPAKELIMNETIFSVAEARNDEALRDFGQKMVRGESTLLPFKTESAITGKESWMTHVPIKSSGWSLAIVFPYDELIEDITRLNRVVLFLGITGIFLLSLAVIYISRSITGPLEKLARATEEIGKGNLDADLPVIKSHDEVGKLAESFAYMKTALKDYIERLTETTALKERMESELKVAHGIQMSILPKVFPPFPDRQEFDIYATIEPAREVGGDFYDFFLIDSDHLCFVIADVSGKGIPAALFMAVTKTLIKSKATVGLTPDRIIARVNEELCVGNDENMFVTLFCGILNTGTGEILYANGGHNPPLIMRKQGEIVFVHGESHLMVGIMEDASYTTERFVLEPGDCLFLYTDGVTEAMNDKNELFPDDQLKNALHKLHGKPIQETNENIEHEIRHFAQGAPQSDDITMMIIKYKDNIIDAE
ncbi:MAG: SpoIIE family protein phosphatase [Deltaproteobacteria bacterium]